MYWRSMRYFTRQALAAAMQECRDAGLPDQHESPKLRTLSKKHRYVIVIAHPFLSGNGTGVPHARCVVQWAEGGMQWTVDVLIPRFRSLPKMTITDEDLYRFQ